MSSSPSEGPWYQPGRWHVSPWNYHPQLEAQRRFPPGRKVFVSDGTIRAICNSEPGAVIDVTAMVDIAKTLDEMGVQEIRLPIGSNAISTQVAEAIAASGVEVPRCGGIKIDVAEIDESLAENRRAQVQRIELEYGPLHPRPGFDYTEAAFTSAEEVARRSRDAGFGFAFGFNITPDAQLDYMLEFYQRLLPFEPVMYRIYDPFTCCGPDAMAWLVRTILDAIGSDAPPLVLHTHNAWGFGAAINIAGVLAGLSGVDVAANAVGNKAGHADFAGTVMGLECLYGVDTGLRLELLTQLAHQVEAAMGTPLHPNTPFVGRHVFVGEKSTLAIRAMRDQYGVEPDLGPYAAKVVGQQKRIVWGKGSTPEVVRTKLELMGIEVDEQTVAKVHEALKGRIATLREYPLWIEDEEAEQIIRQVLDQSVDKAMP